MDNIIVVMPDDVGRIRRWFKGVLLGGDRSVYVGDTGTVKYDVGARFEGEVEEVELQGVDYRSCSDRA